MVTSPGHGLRRSRTRSAPEGDSGLVNHLAVLLDRLGVDCVLDVGANRGQFARLLRDRVGFTGRIVSFEPVPAAYAELASGRTGDDAWIGRQVAVGTQPGFAEINVFPADNLSSFLPVSSYGRYLASEYGIPLHDGVSPTTCRVQVNRLDEEWGTVTAGCSSVFAKVDCQGRDLDVLASAGHRLNELAGILLEVPVQQIYDGMPTFTEALTFLEQSGFDITGMWTENRDPDLRVIEFNCVLRRRIG